MESRGQSWGGMMAHVTCNALLMGRVVPYIITLVHNVEVKRDFACVNISLFTNELHVLKMRFLALSDVNLLA